MSQPDDKRPVTQMNTQARIDDRSARTAAAADLETDGVDITAPRDDEIDEEARRRELEEQLDEGLKESFPGSDPVSVTQPHRHAPRVR